MIFLHAQGQRENLVQFSHPTAGGLPKGAAATADVKIDHEIRGLREVPALLEI